MIHIKALAKTYGQNGKSISVIKDLNLDVNLGETIAILGPSGSGKSTLLSLLAGLQKADAGTLQIGDQNLTSLSAEELNQFRGQKLGIVFQQFYLIPFLTALENVALPLDLAGNKHTEDLALKSLQAVGLENRAKHLPHELSGGENQRVAIARAMVCNPQIILADEPSGNLDMETGEKVMSLLFDQVQKRGSILILVTHNLELAKRCHKIYRLSHGHLEEQTH